LIHNPGFNPEKAFAEALNQAEQAAAEDEVPVGAVIVNAEGQFIGLGYNRREQDQDPLGHAEIMAIHAAARALKSWRLTGCRLVVTLEPCPMCLAACQQARIEEVIYGTPDPKGGAISLGYKLNEDTRTNHRFPVTLSHSESCGKVLTDFFKQKRKN
jgi:tRNA(adenine34) deaminase